MGIAVRDVVCGAVMLAGIGLRLAQRLFERRHAGFILGVNHDVVIPVVTVIRRCRQGDEERRCRGSDVLRHVGLNDDVKALCKIGNGGMAVGVRLRHVDAAVAVDIGFQRVFRLALDGAELTGKAVDQRVAHKLQFVVIDAVGVVTAQAERCKELLRAAGIRQGIQHHILIAGRLLLRVGHDVRHLGVGVDDALQGIRRKRFFHRAVVLAGGYKRRIRQHAVLVGRREIVLVELEGRRAIRIDCRLRYGCGRSRHRTKAHCDGQHNRAQPRKSLHFLHDLLTLLCVDEKSRAERSRDQEDADRLEREASAASARQLEVAAVDCGNCDVGHLLAVNLCREAAFKENVAN